MLPRKALSALCLLLAGSVVTHAASSHGLGVTPNEALIRSWDIDVSPDGSGLPPGRGSVLEGNGVYIAKCAACHGQTGTEGPMDRLVGGAGSLNTTRPVKTIGSFWPHATTLYDYVRRAMPFNAPQSLSADDVYAVVAYLLHLNGILAADAVLDAQTLPSVRMPNREGFRLPPESE